MAKYKVVITDFGSPDNEIEAAELRKSRLSIELVRLNTQLAEEVIQHAWDADAIIVQFTPITREVINHLTRCKVISRYGIGVDMVDINAATEHGIMVSNVPDFCFEEVSTHTLAFVLNLNRRIQYQDRHIRSGNWYGPPGGEPTRITGEVLGIIGLGNIGSRVASKAQALGLRVLTYDPYASAERAQELGVELVDLVDLLRRSDYVTIHCPLTTETHHLIGAREIAHMKRSAFLINMARGPVVNQTDLYHALCVGAIAGAALDVLEQEPPAPGDPLLQLENVLITPHASSLSRQSIVELRRETAHNVVVALKGGIPRSTLNRRELGL